MPEDRLLETSFDMDTTRRKEKKNAEMELERKVERDTRESVQRRSTTVIRSQKTL